MEVATLRSRIAGGVSVAFLAALGLSVSVLLVLAQSRALLTMTMLQRWERSERAHWNAESVLAMARSRVMADRDFGKRGESVLLGSPEPDGTWAEVSFDPARTERSINNLGEASRQLGYGGVLVDSGMCQLVAVSHCGTQRVVRYLVMTGPPLEFSLGASGSLHLGGSTVVGGVESAAALADGLQEEDLLEGGVVANGSQRSSGGGDGSAETAPLVLEAGVKVVGHAQSTGAIVDRGAVLLRGQKKPFSERQELPRLDLRAYDPEGKEGLVRRSETVVGASGPVYGFHRFGASVTFSQPVELHGALLFVDGDVVLEKPLTGTGALVATGKVTLRGGADMKADALAAVLAGEDLTVTGAAGTRTQFTGLLYTEGNLSLSNTRVVGAALANGDGAVGQGSTMSIMDSEVLASPEGQDVAIAIQDFAEGGGGGMGGTRGAETGGADSIIEPTAVDLFVDGEFRVDRTFMESVTRIRYNGVTYDSPRDLPPGAPAFLRTEYDRAITRLLQYAERLQAQHETKPVEIVRFDLNEFLNVSDRLRSSRTFTIEG